MAYMSQEKKKEIHAALKRIIPVSWKWSLGVRHHSTIVLKIAAAPVDLIGEYIKDSRWSEESKQECIAKQRVELNVYHWREHFTNNNELRELFGSIMFALNAGNHDRSDLQTDYFDVGWYVDVRIGQWDKSFVCTAELQKAA